MLLRRFSCQAFQKHKYSSSPEEFSSAVRRGWVQPRETLETKGREGFAVEVIKMLYYIFALEVFTVYSGGIITLRFNLRQYITPQRCTATRREVSTDYNRIRGERERIHFNSSHQQEYQNTKAPRSYTCSPKSCLNLI